MKRPAILFLTRFSALNAASRYRVHQYLPWLENAGFDCAVRPLFPDAYLKLIYGTATRRRGLLRLYPLVARALADRAWLLIRDARRFQAMYMTYEALPYAPLACERVLRRSRSRMVVDFDDAVSLAYERHSNPVVRRLLGPKLPGITAASDGVIVANRTLAAWAEGLNRNVTVIPNSVELRQYPLRTARSVLSERPVIGWIGTPVTAPYLRLIEEPLRRLRARHDFVLKVIGAPQFQMDGIDVVGVPWEQRTEVDELQGCDIGVMPLSDDAWSRGKSALKLIQYLAAGVPAVASPVGANCEVIEPGWSGLFAASDDEWVERLAFLIQDRAAAHRLAAHGRQAVADRFSLEVNAPRLIDVFRRAVA